MIAVEMRRRLPPLIAANLEAAVDENVLPRNEHVVADDEAVSLIEAAAQRIIEGIRRGGGECTARIKLEPGRIDWHDKAVGVILVARLQRVNAAHIKIVRIDRGRRELLRSGNDDAVITLLDDAGMQRRIALFVRRLAAVDLRRHD